jgi:hypothetical protein
MPAVTVPPEPEGVAHRDHPVADAGRVGGELHELEGPAVLHLQEGEVGLRVRAHHLGGERAPVVHQDLHLGALLHHVVVGHHETVRRDEEAGALAQAWAGLARTAGLAEAGAALAAGAAEAAEELLEGMVVGQVEAGAAGTTLRARPAGGGRRGARGLALHAHGHDGGLHPVHHVGE